jgi:modulator of FtsH protease HflK
MTSRRLFIAGVTLSAAAYLASGVTIVQPDEVGVVRRFGAVLPQAREPGLHWGLPWGIDRVDRIKPNQTRTLSVAAPGGQEAPFLRAPDPETDDFLTGDLNLVTAEVLLQYRVRDPAAYLFGTADVDGALAAVARWALVRRLAHEGIDRLLTTGRAEVADALARSVQVRADAEGLGVSVVAVRLGRLTPPAAVAPAFADAARARSDRRQAITRAREYRDRAQSEARGQAREIADAAEGRVARIVQPARGEAERFSKVLAEARRAPDSFRTRLFLTTLAEILPRLRRTIVVAPGQDLDVSLLGDDSPGGNQAGGPAGRPDRSQQKSMETPP